MLLGVSASSRAHEGIGQLRMQVGIVGLLAQCVLECLDRVVHPTAAEHDIGVHRERPGGLARQATHRVRTLGGIIPPVQVQRRECGQAPGPRGIRVERHRLTGEVVGLVDPLEHPEALGADPQCRRRFRLPGEFACGFAQRIVVTTEIEERLGVRQRRGGRLAHRRPL